MPDPIADNPFTKVYNALWTLVESHPDIDSTVRLGNRINFGEENRNVWKHQVAAADVPELVLVQDTTTANLHQTSTSSRVRRDYSWLLSTGDFRLNHFLNPVEWLLITAHTNWKSVLTSLQYNGESFVKRCDILDARTGATDQERNRGLKGWSSVWRVQVEMHFKTSDLRAEATS